MNLRTFEFSNPAAERMACERAMDATAIRVLLIEDQTLLREALGWVLVHEPGFYLAGECSGVRAGLEVIAGKPIDVVLLDTKLASGQDLSFMREARAAGYRGK